MFGFPYKTPKRRSSKARYLRSRLFRPRFEKLEDRSLLSAIAVTTFLDVVDANDGKVSLREAIDQANANPGCDTIQLKSGTYKIGIPGPNEDLNETGDFDILESVKIVGNRCTTIDAQGLDRVFDIPSQFDGVPVSLSAPVPTDGIKVTFDKVKITGGIAGPETPDGGGVHTAVPGVWLCFVKSTVCGNSASGFGGGIYNLLGDVSLKDSHVDNNTAGESGGGIFIGGGLGDLTSFVEVDGVGALSIVGSTVNGNSAGGSGGGIANFLPVGFTLTKSELSCNHAVGDGGGADLVCEVVDVCDSSVSNNTSGGSGGGLNVRYIDLGEVGAISIKNSTFAKNRASGDGGGLNAGGADVNVQKSTFKNNLAGGDGGAIANAFTVEVSRGTFLCNSAFNGGAIHQLGLLPERQTLITQPEPSSGDINIQSSCFKGNAAAGVGGAIASLGNFDDFTIDICDTTFTANTSVGDGGAVFAGLHAVHVLRSTFECNVAGGSGGGIEVPTGTIEVTCSKFLRNRATFDGGGFQAGLQMSGGVETFNNVIGGVCVVDSLFEGNIAANGGGFHAQVENVSVKDSTFSCNTATGEGGGFVAIADILHVTGSTLNDNRAGNLGGGAFIRTFGADGVGTLQNSELTESAIVNSTFSGNTAALGGGGIAFDGPGNLNITYATIAYNIALEGGGLWFNNGTVRVLNTIIAKNTATTDPDVHNAGGTLDDLGHNLIFADPQNLFDDPTDILGQDPKLAKLASNGGKTKTHALLKGSPAIGNATPVVDITTDQRGVTRSTTAPSIGAYEYVCLPAKKSKTRRR